MTTTIAPFPVTLHAVPKLSMAIYTIHGYHRSLLLHSDAGVTSPIIIGGTRNCKNCGK